MFCTFSLTNFQAIDSEIVQFIEMLPKGGDVEIRVSW